MLGLIWSRTSAAAVAALLLSFLSTSADAQILFDLRAQPMAGALSKVGNIANMNVLFDATLVEGLNAPPLKGELSADDALARLLSATKLRVVRVNDNTVSIVAAGEAKRAENAPSAPSTNKSDTQKKETAGDGNTQTTARQNKLDEVLVTAQKRSELLQEVPVPVSTIGAAELTDRNQLQLQDYYSSVPALTVAVNDLGAPQLTIRGLTTGGYTGSTVGVVIDDVPYGSSSPAAYGEEAPDVDPSDLARIEVLRGPQGTLYGASSLGGLLKYVTVDPSTGGVSGRVQAGASSVRNGDGLGYNLRGFVNIPVGETLAVRASGFARQDPGYIDDPILKVRGVNKGHDSGGRLATLWKPSEVFSVKLSALLQHATSDGLSTIALAPGFGDLQQSYVRGAGAYDKRIEAFSANANAKIGIFDLTSITGYNINTLDDSTDYTPFFSANVQDAFGVPGALYVERFKTTKFTQEVRLSTSFGSHVDLLVGGFYDHEHTPLAPGRALAVDPLVGTPVGEFANFIIGSTFSERAVFTNLTFRFTDRVDIQFGGRESQNRQLAEYTITGPYVPLFLGQASPFVYPDIRVRENAFTYLVTPRVKITPDLMLYARLASGYRPGGPNLGANSSLLTSGLPSTYKRDTTQNYEVGFKGEALDHTLSVDTSLYYIDWKNMQLQLLDPTAGVTYFANGSRAKSQGLEISVASKPLRGLAVSAWFALNDAKLTESFSPDSYAIGSSGDRLPYSSRFSGNVTAEQSFAVTDQAIASVGVAVSYVGSRQGVFGNVYAPDRQTFPSYTKTDVHAGLTYGSWTGNLFVNNVTDKRGLIGGGFGAFSVTEFNIIPARTIGLSVGKNF